MTQNIIVYTRFDGYTASITEKSLSLLLKQHI